MKKLIKGLLYFLGGVIALLLLVTILVPVLFKDNIKLAIDEQLKKEVNANVVYDWDKFGLTIFKDFPNISVKIEDVGVINYAPFKGDTLAMIEEFGVTLDLFSVIGGEQMKVNRVYFENPTIKILTNKEGVGNYKILNNTGEDNDSTATSEPLKIKLDYWEITNGRWVYDDQRTSTTVVLNGLNHSGKGDISAIYDLALKTSVDDMSVLLNGDSYYEHSTFDSGIVINIDLANNKYTFKENTLKLNDFAFGFDGFVLNREEETEMYLTYKAKETTFKNVLSLVPGVFLEGFEDIETAGKLGFGGYVKGVLSDTQKPGFLLNLSIKDAMFKYPNLPTAINNIQLDLKVDNEDANMDVIAVELKKLHMDLGSNPVDLNLVMDVLKSEDFDIKDANLKADVKLSEVTSFYPIKDINMKGLLAIDLHAKGVYSGNKELLPTVFGDLKLTKGWVKSTKYKVTAENILCDAWVNYTQKSSPTDTILKVKHLGASIDGERFQSKLAIWNRDDISWDVAIKGLVDLDKVMKLAPIEGTTLKGKIKVDNLRSRGRMSDLDAGNYTALKTYGKATITNFEYVEKEVLPQGVKITQSRFEINPKTIDLKSFNGFLGKSDMRLNGQLSNYMAYVNDVIKGRTTAKGVLKGNLTYYSKLFHTDEWMSEEETAEGSTTTKGSFEDNAIPKNIHFVMDAKIDKILYENADMTDASGKLVIKNGIVDMKNLKMVILGGNFVLNGQYNTSVPTKPTFDFTMDIDKLSFQDSYNAFSTVRSIAPIAKNIEGDFSTKLKVSGPIGLDLLPVLGQINGLGDFFVENAKVQGFGLLSRVAQVTNFSNIGGSKAESNNLTLQNALLTAKIEDGKVIFKPFTSTSGKSNITIGGSRSLDGILDLDMSFDMPMGAIGNSAKNVLAGFGLNDVVGDRVTVPLKITGSENKPKIEILGAKSTGGQTTIKDAVVTKAKDEAKVEIDKVKEAEKAKILAEAQKQGDKLRMESYKVAKQIKDEANKQAQHLEDQAKNPWDKPFAKLAGDKVRAEGVKRANQVTAQANKKADLLMAEAHKKIDKL